MRPVIYGATLVLAFALPASAQFVPALLQNRSYWGDGKSEIDFYQAEFIRDGEPHSCEVLVILTPLFVDPTTFAQVEGKPAGAIPAIRMIETATIPRGLAVELRSIEALWRMDLMSLARLSFTGNDNAGNIAKSIRENRQPNALSWSFSSDSYFGKSDSAPVTLGTKPTVCYDELPLRVRTLDFSKSSGEIEIDLAPTLASTAKDFGEIKPARISWKVEERSIRVEVQYGNSKDQFLLDSSFPFLLRDWMASDRTHWKMKNSFKADYRNYLRDGDRERAWKDPMLRHPD